MSPHKPKSGKTFALIVLIIFVVLVSFWLFYFYGAVTSNFNPKPVVHAIEIPSYYMTLLEYQNSITSIQYKATPKKEDDAITTEPKEVPLFALKDLMSAWEFEDTSRNAWSRSPAHPDTGNGVPRFDFQNTGKQKSQLAC